MTKGCLRLDDFPPPVEPSPLEATAATPLVEEDDGWHKRSSMAPKANGRDFIVVAVMVLSPKYYVLSKDEESGRGIPVIGDAFHFFHL